MTVAVFRIPTQLRPLTGGAGEVTVEGDTVGSAIADLEEKYPGFEERLLDDEGRLRRFLNLFVADEDVRFLDGLDTPITSGQTISIVPAIAGG
jgi:molybdopterin converting factor small subunit